MNNNKNINLNLKTIQPRVLQGSAKIPLLFLIFLYDTAKWLNQFKYIIYADECFNVTKLFNDELNYPDQINGWN